MKAVIYERYGSPDVLRLTEIAQPVPGPGQVRVQIRAAGVNAADWHLLRADPFMARMATGLFKPKRPVLGADIAGVVESVGEGATRFKANVPITPFMKAGWNGQWQTALL